MYWCRSYIVTLTREVNVGVAPNGGERVAHRKTWCILKTLCVVAKRVESGWNGISGLACGNNDIRVKRKFMVESTYDSFIVSQSPTFWVCR